MSQRAETKKLVKRLEKQGFEVTRTNGGHWKVTHPERAGSVIVGFSPGYTGLQQAKKHLKELGYQP